LPITSATRRPDDGAATLDHRAVDLFGQSNHLPRGERVAAARGDADGPDIRDSTDWKASNAII
jgi:hypothetical protein